MRAIPLSLHPDTAFFRVKPNDIFGAGGERTYIRRRIVAIMPNGYAICTCIMERHIGFPCRHFFAVLNHNAQHGFNVIQVHLHWHEPAEIALAQGRPWINLNRTPVEKKSEKRRLDSEHDDSAVPIISHTSSCSAEPQLPDISMVESLDHGNPLAIASGQNIRSAPVTPKKRPSQYHEIQNEIQKFLKSTPPPDIFKETIEYLKERGQEISKRRRIVNMRNESKEEGNSQVSIENLDPLMFPKTGRKASKRIKSSTE